MFLEKKGKLHLFKESTGWKERRGEEGNRGKEGECMHYPINTPPKGMMPILGDMGIIMHARKNACINNTTPRNTPGEGVHTKREKMTGGDQKGRS